MCNEFYKTQYLLWNQTVGEMAPEALVPQFPTDLNANDSAISVPATQAFSFWTQLWLRKRIIFKIQKDM